RRVLEFLCGAYEVAVPRIEGFYHPLSAVYRRSVLPQIELLLAEDRLRAANLFDLVPTREVSAAELSEIDPKLGTLRNLNLLEEYQAALAEAGL
ncbi:MAG TPA: hypothetical protein VHB99_06885, partial [Pirellulales bacterium]|nr:hypothetical protein [Pirellulales bacterium]